MSEIQWIVNLMMKNELSEDVKKLCIERIGEVESLINNRYPIQSGFSLAQNGPANVVTGNLMGQQNVAVQSPHFHNMQGPPLSQAQISDMQRTQAAQIPQLIPRLPAEQLKEIITGGGPMTSIRGPNKMRGHVK